MASNYRKIGEFIELVDERNRDLKVELLLGLSISKVFIPSVANIIGADMANYKIIRRGQFACSIMQVRRDRKMPVALLRDYEEAIISQAYPVFRVINESELLPEYLMMWFSRSEFDRHACFLAVGGVRGSLEWEDFLEMELPIPSIEKQREIVKEYNTVVDRIKLNEQLNQKLEETAQALYKHWFVDFEFPVALSRHPDPEHSGEGSVSIKQNTQGYKTSGGKMVWNEELQKEIPEGWKICGLGDILCGKGYIRGPFGSALKVEDMKNEGIPVYEQQHVLDEHRKFRYFISKEKFTQLKRFSVEKNDIVISCSGVNLGKLSFIRDNDPSGIINQALLILRVDKNKIPPIIVKRFLETDEGKRSLIQESGGSAIPNIAKREIIQSIPFLVPINECTELLEEPLKIIEFKMENLRLSIDGLLLLKDLILAKMTKVEEVML